MTSFDIYTVKESDSIQPLSAQSHFSEVYCFYRFFFRRALAPEYELAKMLIACRNADNLTQKQLSELTGIDQADISKIENGNANPSIKTLTRIAPQ